MSHSNGSGRPRRRISDGVPLADTGVELLVGQSVLDTLREQGLVYYCPTCRAYHLTTGHSWDEVVAVIDRYRKERHP